MVKSGVNQEIVKEVEASIPGGEEIALGQDRRRAVGHRHIQKRQSRLTTSIAPARSGDPAADAWVDVSSSGDPLNSRCDGSGRFPLCGERAGGTIPVEGERDGFYQAQLIR